MKNQINRTPRTSTYALLIRSEDTAQSISETCIYLLLIACAAFSMWFAAHQQFRVPIGVIVPTVSVAESAAVANHVG